MRKCQNTRKHHIQESQEITPFPAGDHKAAINTQDSMSSKHEKHISKRIHKRSTALERSIKKILEDLNMFDRTNRSLIINMDQDK